MPGRPYLSRGVDDLARILKANVDDLVVVDEILGELAFRTTQAARRLEHEACGVRAQLVRGQVPPPAAGPTAAQPQPAAPPASTPQPAASPASPPPIVAPPDPVPAKAPRPLPPVTNRPVGILDAWVAQEVLSPWTFRRPEDVVGGDRSKVADFHDRPLPWEGTGERARPKTRLYYHVMLGSLRMEPATNTLLAVYASGDTEYEVPRGASALAFVTVSRDGIPDEDAPPVVSSFAWGLGPARSGDLSALGGWPAAERELQRLLQGLLLHRDEDGRLLPLTRERIVQAHAWLVQRLVLSPAEVDPPRYAFRAYQWFVLKESPDPPLLNSFYLSDLALARDLTQAQALNTPLRQYLRITAPGEQVDLLRVPGALDSAVAPAKVPAGRWPGAGRRPLVLLQQSAVNLALHELRGGGIASVNGPPGTGKTTLLRDLVAALVVERAEAMAALHDPASGFSHIGQMKVGEGWVHLYALPPSITGFEVLVASSNNKAVENISRELPGMTAISEETGPPRYFRTISDALAEKPGSTWGLIAAVLGNSENRNAFRKAFWQDPETSFGAYLKTANGQPVVVTAEGDPEGVGHEPLIVTAEAPPRTPQQADQQWQVARQKFMRLLGEVREELAKLERWRAAVAGLTRAREQAEVAIATRKTATHALERANQDVEDARRALAVAEEGHGSAENRLRDHQARRPGFWSRLFRTLAWKSWCQEEPELRSLVQAAADIRDFASRTQGTALAAYHRAQAEEKRSEGALRVAQTELQRIHRQVADAKAALGVLVADDAFWGQGRDTLHTSTPWLHDSLQRKRDDLFVAAMAVHRAFHGVAASKIRHNLAALMQVFLGKGLPEKVEQALPDLWRTLFLVTPVVSTTFASVNRMLGRLPPDALGWLLVDEAGQAVPQATVGAMLRCQRALVVGDPLQIEPVVTLSNTLTQAIFRAFGVDPERWAAPQASVQTVVDSVNRFGTDLDIGEGSIRVGMPLLVHRRCDRPMFTISNQIAYSNLMVSAVARRASKVRDGMGTSAWIDVTGSGPTKWSPEEGEAVVKLLWEIVRRSGERPDLFLISPFRVVAQGLRERLRADQQLMSLLAGDDQIAWLRDRVGTVHTFQGKEAEAVVLTLGAPLASHGGARGWAGGRPNILNVAVTRAQCVLYVIGNRQLWRRHGVFGVLDKHLPDGGQVAR